MRNKGWRWAVLGGALTVILLYGLEMTTAGIERIQGPFTPANEGEATVVEQQQEQQASKQEEAHLTAAELKIAELERELQQLKKIAMQERVSNKPGEAGHIAEVSLSADNSAAVNKFADSASDMLQSASSGGIRFVVSIFEGLFK